MSKYKCPVPACGGFSGTYSVVNNHINDFKQDSSPEGSAHRYASPQLVPGTNGSTLGVSSTNSGIIGAPGTNSSTGGNKGHGSGMPQTAPDNTVVPGNTNGSKGRGSGMPTISPAQKAANDAAWYAAVAENERLEKERLEKERLGGNENDDTTGDGGTGARPRYTAPSDTRTQTQKEADFYAAINRAIEDVKAGNPKTLENFDAFFGIKDRPPEEYTAEFYNKPAGDIPGSETPLVEPVGWSEKEYLAKNPDVAEAVEKGDIASGLAHYYSSGKAEGRQSDFTPAGWNEKEYLKMYPDVAAAVEKGDMPSGLAHYFSSGKAEGRQSDFGGSIPTSGVGVLPPSIDPIPPQRGTADDTTSNTVTSRNGGSFIDEPRKPATASPASSPTKPDPMGTIVDAYVRNDKDSGFAYPWSAAKASGTNDVMGTISKAVDFMNANEGKSYKYDQIKGTIRDDNGKGAFINQADTQALNNIITKYSKSDFKIVGAGGGDKIVQPVDLTYGGVGTPQKPILRDVTNGAVKIDGAPKDGLYTTGGGGFAGTTPGVKTHPVEGFNLP